MSQSKLHPAITTQPLVECQSCIGYGRIGADGPSADNRDRPCLDCGGLGEVPDGPPFVLAGGTTAMGDAVALLIDQFTSPADAEMAAMHAIAKLIALDTCDDWLEGVLLNAVELFNRHS